MRGWVDVLLYTYKPTLRHAEKCDSEANLEACFYIRDFSEGKNLWTPNMHVLFLVFLYISC